MPTSAPSQCNEVQIQSHREDLAALLDTLLAAGVFSKEFHLSFVHRRRFAAVMKTYPCAWDASLSDVIGKPELCAVIASFANVNDIYALSGASRSNLHGTLSVRTSDTHNFQRVCVFGGEDDGEVLSCGETITANASDHDSWEQLKPMLQARRGAAAAIVEGRICVMGGVGAESVLRSTESFECGNGQWEAGRNLTSARARAAAFSVGRRLYICGGINGRETLQSVEVCDGPLLNAWSAGPQLLESKCGAGFATTGGRLYLVGGFDGRQALDTVECLDTSGRGAWFRLPSMKVARRGGAASAVGGCIYVCGGSDGKCSSLASVERFDPRKAAWETLASMSMPRFAPAAVAVSMPRIDGIRARSARVFVFGGNGGRDNGNQGTETAEAFDVETGHWYALPPMSRTRLGPIAVKLCA